MKINFNGPILIILISGFILSIGFNILFYNRILSLDKVITHTSSPITEEELLDIKQEVDRLSSIQYDVKTKQPIKNDFLNHKR